MVMMVMVAAYTKLQLLVSCQCLVSDALCLVFRGPSPTKPCFFEPTLALEVLACSQLSGVAGHKTLSKVVPPVTWTIQRACQHRSGANRPEFGVGGVSDGSFFFVIG